MGTWDYGPFDDDLAADFMGGVFDLLMKPVNEFMSEPQIDETFWPSYGAIASMNALMAISVSRPWSDGPVDPVPITDAMRACATAAVDNEEIGGELLERLQPILDEFVSRINGAG